MANLTKKESVVPREVIAGQKTWIKRIIKNNKTLYSIIFKLTRCNHWIYVLRSAGADIDTPFKSGIAIETVSACTRRCSFCPMSKDNSPKGLMTDELFDKILDELKELSYKGVVAFNNYGEPLLDKRLESFIKRVKNELGSYVTFSTNGDLLTSKRFNELVAAGVDMIHVSQHDREPSGTVKELFANINKKDWKYLSYYMVQDDFVPMTNRGGSVDVKSLYPFLCSPTQLFVRANGDVCFCCNDYYGEVKLGNVKNEKLIDIWNKPFYRRVRSDVKSGKFSLDLCKRCLGKAPLKESALKQ